METENIPNPTIHYGPFNREYASQESQYSTTGITQHENMSQSKHGDVTIKKTKPMKNGLYSLKKKDDSQVSNKGSVKLKNVKSEKKLLRKKGAENEINTPGQVKAKKYASPVCKISMKEKKSRNENRILTTAKNKELKDTK